jgi:signal transduction histidine kinase
MAADSAIDVQATLAKLNDAMNAIGRELEATDVAPEYFRQRSIVLPDWLQQMNSRYAAQYREVGLRLVDADSPKSRVFATEYLLDTIFWNIWINAHQAVGVDCEIIVQLHVKDRELVLVVLDNGEGFPHELKDVVFQQMYSTKTPGRGRGMLEIQDAVERLGGRIELYERNPREHRIRIHLPLDLG